jgi:glycogen synthase
MEKLYWKSKYWILPLNNAESELFCLNAIKAQYCGCIPIVNKIGALTETVSNYIEYNDFVKGKLEIIKSNNIIPLFSWKEVVDKFWDKIL